MPSVSVVSKTPFSCDSHDSSSQADFVKSGVYALTSMFPKAVFTVLAVLLKYKVHFVLVLVVAL